MVKDATENIPSTIGKVQERYKNAYYRQSKFTKVAVLPFLTGSSVALMQIYQLSGLWFTAPAFILLINGYHQYLDSILTTTLSDVKKQREKWRNRTERMLHLTNVLKQLVDSKSEIYIDAIKVSDNKGQDVSDNKGQDNGINSIRESGSFKNNIDRITAMLYRVFQEYSDKHQDQQFRVSYLAPDEKNKRLITKSWYNIDKSPPKSVDNSLENFTYGDKTLAGYLWSQSGLKTKFIHDTDEHISKYNERSIFTYTHQGQNSYLKSIACHKVIDPTAHTCLGIICIDTNIPNTLKEDEKFYKTVFDSFEKRILFETRCAYMKQTLDRNATEKNYYEKN